MRIVKTGIKATDEAMEVIESVFGQLSDGIWENTGIDSYWMDADVANHDGMIVFETDEKLYIYSRGETWDRHENRYYSMTDAQILKYFARKIQQIVSEERSYSDNPAKYKFVDTNTNQMDFMGGHICNVTVGDAHKVYRALLLASKEA